MRLRAVTRSVRRVYVFTLMAGALLSPLSLIGNAAPARALRVTNPIGLDGRPFSCPDPDVFRDRRASQYVAACTSDFGEALPGGASTAAFPLYVSRDLRHWRFRSFVYPPGHHPLQAAAPTGHRGSSHYWSPEIHRIAGRWVLYFAAPLAVPLQAGQKPPFALFVAWTDTLFGGRWQTRVLHYGGQFNTVAHNEPEAGGGVIDPSVARDPRTGDLLIAYTRQSHQIYVGRLSPDGLTMQPHIHLAFKTTYPWECDRPEPSLGMCCCMEGPVLSADHQHGVLDMFFNAGGAWTGTYKVGVAFTNDPLRTWVVYPHPILRSGQGLNGPGIGAQPVVGPDGNTYAFFHVQLHPAFNSQARYLAVGRLRYRGQRQALPPSSRPPGGPTWAPVPEIDAGTVRRSIP